MATFPPQALYLLLFLSGFIQPITMHTLLVQVTLSLSKVSTVQQKDPATSLTPSVMHLINPSGYSSLLPRQICFLPISAPRGCCMSRPWSKKSRWANNVRWKRRRRREKPRVGCHGYVVCVESIFSSDSRGRVEFSEFRKGTRVRLRHIVNFRSSCWNDVLKVLFHRPSSI